MTDGPTLRQLSGPCVEWPGGLPGRSQPLGTALEINEGMLRETGDPIVIRFMDMLKWIELLRIVIDNALEKEKKK